MKIPLSAPDIVESEIAAIVEVLRSRHLSLGPKLVQFEEAVANYVGTKFAVAVNSGTSGLHLCVRALGIGEGDEVIAVPFSFVASANAILYERATPVFVDIDPATLNIDARRIEARITARTRALMVVHTFGRPAPMAAIMEIAGRHRLQVIEDACEAIGTEFQGRRVGGFGEAGVFAFYPNKQITTGEGGVVVTNDAETAARVRRMRNQGRGPGAKWFAHEELGFNYRLPELSCALGLSQLARLDAILERREEVAHGYRQRLLGTPDLVLPDMTVANGRISWFVYAVRLSAPFARRDRDWFAAELSARGIGCGRYFAPIHLQPFYRQAFGYRPGDFPVSEAIADRSLSLPFFNRITEGQLDEVSEALLELMAQRKRGQGLPAEGAS
jgi:dTDP-4-amino-4,6-dideoxygalactose transaminase